MLSPVIRVYGSEARATERVPEAEIESPKGLLVRTRSEVWVASKSDLNGVKLKEAPVSKMRPVESTTESE